MQTAAWDRAREQHVRPLPVRRRSRPLKRLRVTDADPWRDERSLDRAEHALA